MIKPEDGDVALCFAGVTFGPREVTVNRRTIVFFVAHLGLKAIAQKGVAPRSVQHKTGMNRFDAAVIVPGLHASSSVVRQKINLLHLATFNYTSIFFAGGIANQDFVKLRTPNLISHGHGLVHGIGKFECLGMVMPG